MADLKEIQGKVKALASKRDQIIRDQGVEERKLEEAYERLVELGLNNIRTLSTEEIEGMALQLQAEFEEKLKELDSSLEKGELLMKKYEAGNQPST